MNILCVGLGGALGSILRYVISLIPYKGTFPLLTLLTNIFGAILIGYIAGFAGSKGLPPKSLLFFKTGLCGGFTTFSTFSLEAFDLITADEWLLAILYILLSVLGSLAGVFLGLRVSQIS